MKYLKNSLRIFFVSAILCSIGFFAALLIYSKNYNLSVYAYIGNGNAAAPYEIECADDLIQLAVSVNNGSAFDGYSGVTFVLKNDISLSEVQWSPIGTYSYPFKGAFDAAGFSVTDLNLNDANAERFGLFGETGTSAVIKNLSVYGSINGSYYTAGIVGYNQGTIENCKNYCSISAQDQSIHIGGVAGYNKGKIIACENHGSIITENSSFVGGIVGSNYGDIEKSCNTAEIFSSDANIGGIVGVNSFNCNIDTCLNDGTINGKHAVGGMAGNNQGLIKNAFNSGNIISVDGTAGGIAGNNERTGVLSYALSAAGISGYSFLGGVCGYNSGVITNTSFDNDLFGGTVTNNILAERSISLPTYLMVHEDVLVSYDKLALLLEENVGAWVKSSTSMSECYYPELAYFDTINSIVSKVAAKSERVLLLDSDVTLNKQSVIYNGLEQTVEVFYGNILLEVEQDYTAVYSDNINAGKVDIEITFLNGFIGTIHKSFTIEQSSLTVAWTELSFFYNGKEQAPTVTVLSGGIDGENITFEYVHDLSVNIGTYAIIANLEYTAVNANYSLSETFTFFIISCVDITIEWTNEHFVYNGEVQLPTAYVKSGRIGEENITFRYEYSENIHAGMQLIKAFLDEENPVNTNYNLLTGANENQHQYLIEKRPITVKWLEENDKLIYDGTAQYPKAEVQVGKIGDEDITFAYSDYAENINANEEEGYFVTLNLADGSVNANYSFDEVRYNYKIYKRPINIEWWDAPLTYNGKAQCPNFYILYGQIGEENITFTLSDYSSNITASSGGAYQIKISLADTEINSNYMFEPITKSYDIEKAEFHPNQRVEFRSVVFAYDGTAKNLSIVGELPSGVSVNYENNGQSAIGKYTVTARFLVDLKNYLPLSEDTLTATLYIAQMIFDGLIDGIVVKNLGNAIYDLNVEVNKLDEDKLNGGRVLAAYSFTSDLTETVEISLPLSEKNIKRRDLKVYYEDLNGDISEADSEIIDGKLIFVLDGVKRFVIVYDSNLLPLWISLGVGAFMIAVGGIILLLLIKKRRFVNVQFVATDNIANSTENQNEIENKITTITVEKTEPMPDEKISKSFVLDGVYCDSFELFIASLQYKNVSKQNRICSGDISALKLYEATANGTAFWQGERYHTKSLKYKLLIEKARELGYGEKM